MLSKKDATILVDTGKNKRNDGTLFDDDEAPKHTIST